MIDDLMIDDFTSDDLTMGDSTIDDLMIGPTSREVVDHQIVDPRIYEAALSPLAGTAASAAAKPIFEWVPSQNGLVVEPPQRQSANGRFAI